MPPPVHMAANAGTRAVIMSLPFSSRLISSEDHTGAKEESGVESGATECGEWRMDGGGVECEAGSR